MSAAPSARLRFGSWLRPCGMTDPEPRHLPAEVVACASQGHGLVGSGRPLRTPLATAGTSWKHEEQPLLPEPGGLGVL